MRQPGRRPYQHTRRVGGCGAPGGPGADRAQASPPPSASPSPATSRSGVALALRTLFLRQGCWPLRGWVRKRGVPPAPPTTPGEWQTPARPRCPARRSAPPIRGTLARRPSPGRLRAGYHLEAAARHRHAPPPRSRTSVHAPPGRTRARSVAKHSARVTRLAPRADSPRRALENVQARAVSSPRRPWTAAETTPPAPRARCRPRDRLTRDSSATRTTGRLPTPIKNGESETSAWAWPVSSRTAPWGADS